MLKRLDEFKIGETGLIKKVEGEGRLRRRLLKWIWQFQQSLSDKKRWYRVNTPFADKRFAKGSFFANLKLSTVLKKENENEQRTCENL